MRLKLMSGVSYRRQGLFLQRGEEVEVSDEDAVKLMKTGKFAEAPEPAPAPEEPAEEPAKEPEPEKDADPEKKDGAVNV